MYDEEEVTLPKGVDSWFSRTNGNVFQGIMMGSYENQYRRYCEVITAMDRDIQVLADRVDELGLRDNTIIVYAGDNGMMWGEHRRHGIKYPNEESIRLALIVRCPWLVRDPGQRRSQMVLNVDFAPTFLDIGGVAVPEEMEGQSLLPILEDRDARGRQAWLLEYWKYFPENFPSYVGVRTETHKYIEYEKTFEPDLFDLTADPGESRNLYGTPAGEKIFHELKGVLEALKSGRRM
jgi:arylsulfatase A-like enzyme